MLSTRTAYFDLSIVITSTAKARLSQTECAARTVYGCCGCLCWSQAWAEVQELSLVVWLPRRVFPGSGKTMSAAEFVERSYGEYRCCSESEDKLRVVWRRSSALWYRHSWVRAEASHAAVQRQRCEPLYQSPDCSDARAVHRPAASWSR